MQSQDQDQGQGQKEDQGQRRAHEYFMAQAIIEGRKLPRYPFGAVIVRSGLVVARGVNASAKNPTDHGEIVAIDDLAQRTEAHDWGATTLYTTSEPCPMCMSACAWAGIRRVVWGTSIEGLRRTGLDQIGISATAVAAASRSFYSPQLLLGGVLADQTDALFRRAQAIRDGEIPADAG
ncbi:nucleoside deaminase [Kitasatospora brasiliensis]|uniref:nucleoside deaminase n=1 Tax=Kitasatospora brasiliensis TaxID=3058040 RepID=UPI00292E2CB6|nr:nucleoside deaminase [Kitasatospora sp. K002]